MEIQVDCYAGYRNEETPRRIRIGQEKINVIEIKDRWISPDHRFFNVIGDDKSRYLIRHDSDTLRWELIERVSTP